MPKGRPWEYDPVVGGEAPSTALSLTDEKRFQSWYAQQASRHGLNPNPDDPQHFYDYRAAFRAGATPDASGHWPSEYKLEGHPNLVVDGIDSRTGLPAVAVPGETAIAAAPGAPAMAPEARRRAEFMAGSKVASAPYTEPTATGRAIGAGIGAATMLAIPGGAAARTVLPFARAAALAARVVGSVAKDLAISQGVEELAKATGIPGAGAVAELMLGGKAVKTGAKALLEKSFAKWAAERAAAGGARAAAPIAATAAKIAAEGVTPSTVAAVARQVGRAVKPDYPAVLAFAKNAGKGGKKGEKIWMLLDDAGKPVKRLTSDQAGAAARAGKPTTFFSNLWAS